MTLSSHPQFAVSTLLSCVLPASFVLPSFLCDAIRCNSRLPLGSGALEAALALCETLERPEGAATTASGSSAAVGLGIDIASRRAGLHLRFALSLFGAPLLNCRPSPLPPAHPPPAAVAPLPAASHFHFRLALHTLKTSSTRIVFRSSGLPASGLILLSRRWRL